MAMAAVLAGCGGAGARHSSIHTSVSAPIPGAGSVVGVAVPSLPTNFNPLTPAGDNAVTREVMAGVWPSAFLVNSDFAPTVNYALLSSAELVSVDPQTVVYRIDPKASWSDGVPVSAEDFVYDWHAQDGDPTFTDVGGKPFSAVSSLGYSDIASVSGSNGGKTVTVVFKEPFSDWESLFDPIVPAHIAQKVGWNTGFATFDPAVEVSAGPYAIQSVSGSHVILEANAGYWGSPPDVDRIDLRVIANPSDYPAALASGQVAVAEAPAEVDLVQELSYLSDVDSELVPSLEFEEIDFNERNLFLAQLPVRQAIADATDRNALIAAGPGQLAQFQQFQLPSPDDNHFFVPGSTGTAQATYYKANGSGYDSPHPNQAARLLAGAGFVLGSDRFWHQGSASGPALSFRYTTVESDPFKLAVAQTFQAQMKAAGIQITLVDDTPGQLASDMQSGNYDIAEATRSASPYPSEFLGTYGTQIATPPALVPWPLSQAPAVNQIGYSDPAVNELFVKAIASPDPYDSAGVYNQIDGELWDEMVSLPLYEDSELVAHSTQLSGLDPPNGPNVSGSTLLWDAGQWSLREENASTTTSTARPRVRSASTTARPRASRSAPTTHPRVHQGASTSRPRVLEGA